MKKLSKNISLNALEELVKYSPKEISIPLDKIKQKIFLIPTFLQVIATIDKNENTQIFFDLCEKDDLRKKVFNETGFSLLTYMWFKGILDTNGKDYRSLLKTYTTEYYSKLQTKLYAFESNSITISSFDHLPPEKGMDKLFYNLDGSLILDEELIYHSLSKILTYVLRFKSEYQITAASLFTKKVANIHVNLSKVIWELFKNTHEHARTDRYGNPFKRNIRGVHSKFYRMSMKSIENNYTNQSIKSYLLDSKIYNSNLDYVDVIEISVFDSGPGFINRNSSNHSNDVALTEQVQIIKDCLKKNKTSVTGVRGQSKGYGLDYVLETLSDFGLLRIRTEEVCIYRNMIIHPYSKIKEKNEMLIQDWHTGKSESFTKLAKIKGSTVSILYPLSINE